MICHGFKGGIGTASRLSRGRLDLHGRSSRPRRITDLVKGCPYLGVPIGEAISEREVPLAGPVLPEGPVQIIGVVATDAR